ncbi:MAG: phage integrase N-terminal SAM-like domain-containing protein [Akkermansiaceae bacterium]
MNLEEKIWREIRRRGMVLTTEKSYVEWYRRFVRFHGMIHRDSMDREEVEAFLNDLVLVKNLRASTQAEV